MADIVIDPALVLGRGRRGSGMAAGAASAGQLVYRDAFGRWAPASAAAVTSRARTPGAVALNAVAEGQPLALQRGGLIDLGADLLVAGVVYYLSATPGRLCRLSDLDEGEAVVAAGVAFSARLLWVSIVPLGAGDAAIDDPPVNVALPVILGVAQVGVELLVAEDAWEGDPTSFDYQWRRAGADIDGAEAQTYTPVEADLGSVLSCAVTANNAAGSTLALSANTAAVIAADEGGGEGGELDFSDPDNSGLIGLL